MDGNGTNEQEADSCVADDGRNWRPLGTDTEICSETSAGSYGGEKKERTARSKAAGIIKGATAEIARMALAIGLELLLAKRVKDDERKK